MIKQFGGFKPQQMRSGERLPAGGYVLRIKDATVENYDWGQKLRISFDIDEGEHYGFFAEQWRNDNRDDKKWKGVMRLTLPKDPADCRDQKERELNDFAIRKFNDFIWCVEDSNPAFSWEWDETKLKDLIFGGVFREEEWEWEGKTGWKTAFFKSVSADDIRGEKFTVPDKKPLQKETSSSFGAFSYPPASSMPSFEEVNDDDVPF